MSPVTPGSRLGPYEVVSALGAGGMGEVYKARDTRLDRSVAIKVLPTGLAADPEFRERFEREARAISQLTHPHICVLYDVGNHEGTEYLVMELLDGPTLAARIAKGPMPAAEALPIAIQIGEALAAAHRAGLVHRDLKPGNVMLTKSGAKLLDFGLAKATGVMQSTPGGQTMMLTTPPAMTAQGAIVGTFQYMAPEQVEGHDADARSDIFAFGCVLYEMLTGRTAFEGRTHASLIGAIMHAEPRPLSGILPSVPPALDRVLRKCLAKDPDERWQSARDLVDELKWLSGADARADVLPSAPRLAARSSRLPWALAAASMLVAAALATTLITQRSRPEKPAPSVRFTLGMPEGWTINSSNFPVALSPDGAYVVLSGATRGEGVRLWVRPLNAARAQPIPNTERGGMPFWSPDGRWVAFLDESTHQLKKTDVAGTQVSIIAERAPGGGGSWNAGGVILLGSQRGIYQVPASGGTPAPVITSKPGDGPYLRPAFLPDGRHFVYGVFAGALYIGALDGSAPRELLRPTVRYLLSGDELFYLRGTTLVSQRLDVKAAALVGEATPILDGVTAFELTPTLLLYESIRAGGSDDLVWFDRGGRRADTLGDRSDYSNVELSPDATRLATAILPSGGRTRDIWIFDVARGIPQRFTFGEGDQRTAIWSPDGTKILYNVRNNALAIELFQKAADGSGREEPMLVDGLSKDPLSWSSDGHSLLYRVSGAQGGNDLWVLPTVGDRKPFPFAATPFDEQDGRISPDGRWAAYSTNESGQVEVYVAQFPSGRGKTRISSAGGAHPRWRHDGRELFYVSIDNKIMAVDVALTAEAVRAGDVHSLFEIHPPMQPGFVYDVTPDGQKFLVIVDSGASTAPTAVTNWRTAR